MSDVVTEAHAELDRVSIPRVDQDDGHTPLGLVQRVRCLTARYGEASAEVAVAAITARRAPFEIGEEVCTTRDLDFGPQGIVGTIEGIVCQGGVWLAEVAWSNGEESDGIDCGLLKSTQRKKSLRDVPTSGEAIRKLHSSPEGHPWKGTEPGPGTRRAMIRDVVRDLGERTEGNTTPLMIADVIESELLAQTIDAEDDSQVSAFEVMRREDGMPFIGVPSLIDLLSSLAADVERRLGDLPVESPEQAEAAEKCDDGPEDEYSVEGDGEGPMPPMPEPDPVEVVVAMAAAELVKRIESGKIGNPALVFALERLS
jgi:hypothetical protein